MYLLVLWLHFGEINDTNNYKIRSSVLAYVWKNEKFRERKTLSLQTSTVHWQLWPHTHVCVCVVWYNTENNQKRRKVENVMKRKSVHVRF